MKPGSPLYWRYETGRIDRIPDPPRTVHTPEVSFEKLPAGASERLRRGCQQGFVRFVEYGPTVAPDGPGAGQELLPGGSCFMITAPRRGFALMEDDQIVAFMQFGSDLARELESLGQTVFV